MTDLAAPGKSSNFELLRVCGRYRLFEIAHSAEQLYVSGYRRYVPTALRIYCEGVIRQVLNLPDYQADQGNLHSWLRELASRSVRPDILHAAHELRRAGDRSGRYYPDTESDQRLLLLFREAVKLQNFLIIDIQREPLSPARFSPDDFPFPEVKTVRQPDDEELQQLADQIRALQEKHFGSRSRHLTSKLTPAGQAHGSIDPPCETSDEEVVARLATERELLLQKITTYFERKRQQEARLGHFRGEEARLNASLTSLGTEMDQVVAALHQAHRDDSAVHAGLESRLQQLEQLQRDQWQTRAVYREQTTDLGKEQSALQAMREALKRQSIQALKPQEQDLQPDDGLDAAQDALLQITAGKHFLVAPPGAGKTRILTGRLQRALLRHEDHDILCLTFTTRAAEEMQQRAAGVLMGRSPFLGSFHAFCLLTIRNSDLPGWRYQQFGILDDEYRELIWEKARQVPSEPDDRPLPEEWLTLVTGWWQQQARLAPAHGRSAAELSVMPTHTVNGRVLPPPPDKVPLLRHAFYDAYTALLLLHTGTSVHHRNLALGWLKDKSNDLLHAAVLARDVGIQDPAQLASWVWRVFLEFRHRKEVGGSLDFDDILVLGLLELASSKRQYAFVQVDEVQDLSPVQWEIINTLSGPNTHLFVAGDPEQSIYSFLGADILALSARVATFERHVLLANHRSDPRILQILNSYRKHHWRLPAIQTARPVPVPQIAPRKPHTLLLEYQSEQIERERNVAALIKILSSPDGDVPKNPGADAKPSLGILLPTNQFCEAYGRALQERDIPFFQLSSCDLMQHPLVRDWLAMLKVSRHASCSSDWWRLCYRFVSGEPGMGRAQVAAIAFVDGLGKLGVCPADLCRIASRVEVDTDPESAVERKEYPLKQLISAFRSGGVVIFDTETTHLEFNRGKIVQLAAVRVVNGQVVEVFDQYVQQDFDSNPALLDDFEKSQAIHHIPIERVRSGAMPGKVLKSFFRFVDGAPVIAHNLAFDLTMLRMNLLDLSDNYVLMGEFHALNRGLKFDTLTLSRQLYPHFASHKLADLLANLNLVGTNSHNAVDDVKATASLLTHIVENLEEKLEQIDQVLRSHMPIHQALERHWPVLSSLFQSCTEGGAEIALSDTLYEWIAYAEKINWYAGDALPALRADIEAKLLPWLAANGFAGVIDDLMDERRPDTERLFTLKETDMIDRRRHAVVVSTVHRAKGLEFDVVMVPGVTDAAYPPWRPPTTPASEMERIRQESCRLLYVAMSRPKHRLIVSWHRQYKNHQRGRSAFLDGCAADFEFDYP